MQTFIYISLLCVLSVASALCSVLINPQIPPALSPLQRLIGCGGFSPVVSRIRMTGRKSKGGGRRLGKVCLGCLLQYFFVQISHQLSGLFEN